MFHLQTEVIPFFCGVQLYVYISLSCLGCPSWNDYKAHSAAIEIAYEPGGNLIYLRRFGQIWTADPRDWDYKANPLPQSHLPSVFFVCVFVCFSDPTCPPQGSRGSVQCAANLLSKFPRI